MSLNSVVQDDLKIRARLAKEFPLPSLGRPDTDNLLRPQTKTNSGTLGTAFDYLFRFHLQSLNPNAISGRWIAEMALDYIKGAGFVMQYCGTAPDGIPIEKPMGDADSERFIRDAREAVTEARHLCAQYIETRKLQRELVASTLRLARLDVVWRTKVAYDKRVKDVDERDIDDLKSLIERVDSRYLTSSTGVCVLNPMFGKAADLVGGADADIVVDHLLLDIKTTIEAGFSRKWFNQLIGYYLLYKISGIEGMPPDHEIRALGVYSARYNWFAVFRVEDMVTSSRVENLAKWFKRVAPLSPFR
jgi:hypothetical protein